MPVDVEAARRDLQYLIDHYSKWSDENERRGSQERAHWQSHIAAALSRIVNDYLTEGK